MRWNALLGLALGLGLAGAAAAQESKDETDTQDDIDIEAMLADEKPSADEATAAESEATKAPEPTAEQKADAESLSLVSYGARSYFDSEYYGHTLVRAERHLGHVDVYFITAEGKKMMAEVRPDNSIGKVERASF